MSLLLLLLTTGCGTVVYRVNPESPPQMSASEATDAIELSLSLMIKPYRFAGLTVKESAIELRNSELTTSQSIRHLIYIAYYDKIDREVFKTGAHYAVRAHTTSWWNAEDILLFWKDEADARNFVDASYVLRKRQFPDKHLGQAATAQVHPVPSKKFVADKGKSKSIKDEPPDTAKKKDAVIVAVQTPPAGAPATVTVEKTPPKLTITSPDVTRAVSLVAKKSSITIIGTVESKIDIADVLINGQQADLDEKGNFSADVLLKVGKNDIKVTAIDIHKNRVTKQFVINRGTGKVAMAKKEEPVREMGFASGKYHALLIAVQDYSNPEIGKLDYPASDARQLMEVLSSRYNFEKENIRILNNPDRRTIYKTLQNLRKELTDKDNLLIFYAGHGMWLDDMKQGFWLPRDAAGLNDPSDWIPNSTIRDYIKAIKAKHILLVADACFSGGIFKLREASGSPGISVEKIYELPSRKAMTSGSLKTVPDQSVFVEFLIKRLMENNEPYLDSQKLFARLREAVINNSKVNQTPLYGAINETGDEGGDFVFVRRQ